MIARLHAERGEKIAADVLRRIKGKFLDNGVYLDELKKLSHDEQRAKVERDIHADVKRRKRRKRTPIAPSPLPEEDDASVEEGSNLPLSCPFDVSTLSTKQPRKSSKAPQNQRGTARPRTGSGGLLRPVSKPRRYGGKSDSVVLALVLEHERRRPQLPKGHRAALLDGVEGEAVELAYGLHDRARRGLSFIPRQLVIIKEHPRQVSNARGVRSARGGRWHVSSVQNLIARSEALL